MNDLRTDENLADVNDYLQETMGGSFTAKDFRSWAGTHVALHHLLENTPESEDDTEKLLLEAVDLAAEHLGNTRTVAREHYIAPELLRQVLAGTLWSHDLQTRAVDGLNDSERRTLAWLETSYPD